ncbi:hypothetical protein EAF00_011960 [Botryotinia globosa]|nr:hypothetical protein EAF00_011960 [Botryotinia globosa]
MIGYGGGEIYIGTWDWDGDGDEDEDEDESTEGVEAMEDGMEDGMEYGMERYIYGRRSSAGMYSIYLSTNSPSPSPSPIHEASSLSQFIRITLMHYTDGQHSFFFLLFDSITRTHDGNLGSYGISSPCRRESKIGPPDPDGVIGVVLLSIDVIGNR